VSGDAVALRDRVVRWVLGCGGVAAVLAWFVVGRWPALVLIALTVVGAAVVYRIEPPRIDLDGTPWLDETADQERTGASDQ
jgi:hypothetical protein